MNLKSFFVKMENKDINFITISIIIGTALKRNDILKVRNSSTHTHEFLTFIILLHIKTSPNLI